MVVKNTLSGNISILSLNRELHRYRNRLTSVIRSGMLIPAGKYIPLNMPYCASTKSFGGLALLNK